MSSKDAISQPRAEIQNRADLIQALTVASQLEHGLMLMYLYAAFSMKSFPEELTQNAEPEVLRSKLRNWEAGILRVARQEMEHLGFVCNMLSAIGGNQYFDRPNFPQPKQFWPVKLPIQLERFNVSSLLRFLAFAVLLPSALVAFGLQGTLCLTGFQGSGRRAVWRSG